MFEILQQICILLSQPKITAQDLSTNIGTIVEDHGESLSIIVQPSDQLFKEAVVTRMYKSQEAAGVRLQVAESKKLSIQELKSVFGEYKESVPIDWNWPREIIFYVNVPTSPYKCGIIAAVKPGKNGIEDGTAKSLVIRY